MSIIQLENGEKTEYLDTRVAVNDGTVWMRLHIEGRKCWFAWSEDGVTFQNIGKTFDTTKYSDEYCAYGEFTGTMVGLTCVDRMKHRQFADFDYFEYLADENRNVD